MASLFLKGDPLVSLRGPVSLIRKLSWIGGILLPLVKLCWRRLLRAPWPARRSNQSILNEINPEYLLEGLVLKLKLQYFGHLMRRGNSLEKTLMLGEIEGRRKREPQRIMRCLDGITDSMGMSLSRLQEINKVWYRNKQNILWNKICTGQGSKPGVLQFMG